MFFTVLVNVAFKKLRCVEFNQEKMNALMRLIAIMSEMVGMKMVPPTDMIITLHLLCIIMG